MKKSRPPEIILVIMGLSALLFSVGCAKQDGTVAGTVNPPAPGVSVAALQNGTTVSSVQAGADDGKFSMELAPGRYDITVSTADSSFPVVFHSVLVEPGKTTDLSSIDLPSSAGQKKGMLSGRITPAHPGTRVRLLAEGRERASVGTDNEGDYIFRELPAGSYALHAETPDYVPELVPVTVTAEGTTRYNISLFYASAIEGVDWTAGKIRVTGLGVPPHNSVNQTIRREMARRAALADAQRKLLKAVSQIKVAPEQSLQSRMGEKKFSRRIEGFLKGYKVVGEREQNGGSIELDLELPVTGQNGLARYLSE